MRPSKRTNSLVVILVSLLAAACASSPLAPSDAGSDAGVDAGRDAGSDAGMDGGFDAGLDAGGDAGIDAGPDAGPDGGDCFLLPDGVSGVCLDAGDCSAIPDHTPESGACGGTNACCIQTPDPANNPPIPDGWKVLPQPEVTPEMTDWAVAILNDPTNYPMFSTATQQFGALEVMAVVEWASPDFSNSSVHRGVVLLEPAGDGG